MNKLAKKITFSLLSLLAVGTMIGADVAYTTFEADILGQLCPPIVDESAASVAKSEGMDLAKKIEEEGNRKYNIEILKKMKKHHLILENAVNDMEIIDSGVKSKLKFIQIGN